MKKRIMIAALAAIVLSAPAQAQVKFGLKAGINATDMHLSKDVFDASNRAGWFAGPMVKVSLPLTGLSVDAAALYDYRESRLKDDAEEEKTIKQQQIAIPVNLRYGIGLGDFIDGFLFAGPQWGINVGDRDFDWKKGSSYSLKKSNFSINVGLGITALQHLQVTANYNIVCGKSADVTWSKALSETSNAITGKSRSNSWQLGVAYIF